MNSRRQELQSPGAGIPALESFVLNGAFRFGCMIQSDAAALRRFNREGDTLAQIASDSESYDVFHPLLIPRVIGIEDSSREWSVMMVLQHLCMVNRDIVKIVEALIQGIRPRGTIDIALYQPEENLDWDVLDNFQNLNQTYTDTVQRLINQQGSLRSSTRYRHPWFGLLNAHQWHCLAAAHQQIHRRQAQKIVAMLGVV